MQSSMSIEIRHLRYFVAVAEEGSFTRAARMLHMAQPPLSAQIRQLERRVGGELFVRGTGPVQLTDAGMALLDFAYAAIGAIRRGVAAARRVSRRSRAQRAFARRSLLRSRLSVRDRAGGIRR